MVVKQNFVQLHMLYNSAYGLLTNVIFKIEIKFKMASIVKVFSEKYMICTDYKSIARQSFCLR